MLDRLAQQERILALVEGRNSQHCFHCIPSVDMHKLNHCLGVIEFCRFSPRSLGYGIFRLRCLGFKGLRLYCNSIILG